MRTTCLPTLVLGLFLLTSCGGNAPADPASEATPAAGADAPPESSAASTVPMVKSAGMMSYDGNHAILTDCDGGQVFLKDDLMMMLVDEIKRFKVDPNYALWVVVETPDKEKPSDDRMSRVYSTGVILSKELGNPCNDQQDK